jgi:hypothetical protein
MAINRELRNVFVKRTVGYKCRVLLLEGTPRDYLCKVICIEEDCLDEDGDPATRLEVDLSPPIPITEWRELCDLSSTYYTVDELSKFW